MSQWLFGRHHMLNLNHAGHLNKTWYKNSRTSCRCSRAFAFNPTFWDVAFLRWYMKYFGSASPGGIVEAFYKSFMPDVQRTHHLENLIESEAMAVVHQSIGPKTVCPQDLLGAQSLACHVCLCSFQKGVPIGLILRKTFGVPVQMDANGLWEVIQATAVLNYIHSFRCLPELVEGTRLLSAVAIGVRPPNILRTSQSLVGRILFRSFWEI